MKESGEALDGESRSTLPGELRRFFERGPFSLLVKGAAGTGKSTLALAIMRELGVRENFLYVSTRERPDRFFKDYDWVKEYFAPETPGKGESKNTPDPKSSFVDARLDEPTQILERITSQLMDINSPLIAVDTWDSMEDFGDPSAVRTNARVLHTWSERAGATLIMTMENPRESNLDSLVDGIVTLEIEEVEGRRLREMKISKLYGVKIDNPAYYFTLDGGRFRTFEHYQPESLELSVSSGPVKQRGPKSQPQGYFPLGFAELDDSIGGGIPEGASASLVSGAEVNPKVAFLLLAGLVRSFGNSGGPTVVLPDEDLDPPFLSNLLRSTMPRVQFEKIKFLGAAKELPKTADPASPPTLMILDRQRLSEEEIRASSSVARSTRGVTVYLERARKGPERDGVANPAVRLHLSYSKGTLLLEPKVPLRHVFGLTVTRGIGLPNVDLEPIV